MQVSHIGRVQTGQLEDGSSEGMVWIRETVIRIRGTEEIGYADHFTMSLYFMMV